MTAAEIRMTWQTGRYVASVELEAEKVAQMAEANEIGRQQVTALVRLAMAVEDGNEND